MSEALSLAGTLGYAILAVAGLGALLAIGMGVLSLSQRRIPLAAFVALPFLALALGALSSMTGAAAVVEGLAQTDPAKTPELALIGTWTSSSGEWLALWAAAWALIAGAWGAAIGAFGSPGVEPKWTIPSMGLSGGIVGIGAIVLAVFAWRGNVSTEGWMLILLVLVGGGAATVAAARRATDDAMWRVAGMRFTAAMCFLLGTFQAARAVIIGNMIAVFGSAAGPLSVVTNLNESIVKYDELLNGPFQLAVVAMVVALVAGTFAFITEITEVVERFTMFDGLATGAMLVGLTTVQVMSYNSTITLRELASSEPALKMYAEMGQGLAPAVVSVGEEGKLVRPSDGGYGDVLTLEGGEWVRAFAWEGTHWREDGAKVADIELGDRPPLLAIGRSDDAKLVFEALSAAPAKKGFLLMRANEVKLGSFVPNELARHQITLLPVEIAESRDLKTELWAPAGSASYNWGPTTWYGEKDDAMEISEYIASVVASTQSPGLNVLVENRKVLDVIGSCLPFIYDVVDANPVLSQRWCRLTDVEFEVAREEAAVDWVPPVPENVTMKIEIEGPLQLDEVTKFIEREIGGIGWCGEKAVVAGEELVGPMGVILPVSRTNGDVFNALLDEKSKVASAIALRCIGKRFTRLTFTVPEPPPPPDPNAPPPPPPDPKAKPPEPEPPPKVTVQLVWKPLPPKPPEGAPPG